MICTEAQGKNFLAALLALLEAKEGMIERRFVARQARMMYENPNNAHLLLSQRELKHYLELLRN